MTPVLRVECPGDYSAIRFLLIAAFGQSGEADLVERLRASPEYDAGLSLVAELDGRVVGHILFTPVSIESPRFSIPALALAPLAVGPEFQRGGVGGALVRAGLEACRAAGHRLIVVVGHPEYYSRFGFAPAHWFGIRTTFEVPAAALRVLALAPDALTGVSGLVRYPAPFGL